jgi:hypothetical protein
MILLVKTGTISHSPNRERLDRKVSHLVVPLSSQELAQYRHLQTHPSFSRQRRQWLADNGFEEEGSGTGQTEGVLRT